MDLHALITICKNYSSLGWAVKEQLDQYVDDPRGQDVSRGAKETIREFLSSSADAADSEDSEPQWVDDIGAILELDEEEEGC